MTIQTAIRVIRMMEMKDSYGEEFRLLQEEGVIGPGTNWLTDACKVAAECMEKCAAMEDDGK